MATAFYSTPVEHSSDATFRTWGLALSTAIGSVGMVQTADTGQIDWTTVTRPAINTAAGYEIWRFDDTQQGAAPIFIKLEFGTGTVATYPQMWATAGTGTDGAGNITGVGTTRTTMVVAGALASTVTNYETYVCATEGAFWFSWKIGSLANQPRCCFSIHRSTDATGQPNSDGFSVYHINNTSPVSVPIYSVSFITNTVYVSNIQEASFIAYALTTSTVGVTPQVFKHYLVLPRVRPNAFALTCRSITEIPQFNQFLATTVGSVQRNYIALGHTGGGAQAGITGAHLALVYE